MRIRRWWLDLIACFCAAWRPIFFPSEHTYQCVWLELWSSIHCSRIGTMLCLMSLFLCLINWALVLLLLDSWLAILPVVCRVQCMQDIETLGWNPFADMFLICVIYELSTLYL